MYLTQLQLSNFRCFSATSLEFSPGVNLITGPNGSGKTSLLEALHYLCYLRSFRTYYTRELTQLGQTSFFLRATFQQASATHQLQVGFTPQKRLLKLDQAEIKSYRELLQNYCALSLVEDDLGLIQGQPARRRDFLDQYLALCVPDYLKILAEYKRILANRNRLIYNLSHTRFNNAGASLPVTIPADYQLWTEQLHTKSVQLQNWRAQALVQLQTQLNLLLAQYFPDTQLTIELIYQPKSLNHELAQLCALETRWRRTLFGAHLDDFTIQFSNLKSRLFASRGQQKLILTLLRLAQYNCLTNPELTNPELTNLVLAATNQSAFTAPINPLSTPDLMLNPETPGVFLLLLDDFMTDLDEHWLRVLVAALVERNCQLIFTSPSQTNSAIQAVLQEYNPHLITLS